MKKYTAIAASALVLGSVLVPSTLTALAAQVDETQAREIALSHAGVSQDQVAFIQSKLDSEQGRQVYEVEFYTKDYREFDYDIEVSSGTVLSFDYDSEYYDAQAAQNENRYLNGSLAAQTNPGQVSVEDAKKKALEHAGIAADQATFVKAEIDYDDGRQVYELEFYTNDSREFDYEIDTENGSILSYDFEAEYWQKPAQASGSQNSSAITEDRAREIAASLAGLNVSDVTFRKIKQDMDDGRLCYEGEFIHGTTEYEFEIDASTGKVTDWDRESIYD